VRLDRAPALGFRAHVTVVDGRRAETGRRAAGCRLPVRGQLENENATQIKGKTRRCLARGYNHLTLWPPYHWRAFIAVKPCAQWRMEHCSPNSAWAGVTRWPRRFAARGAFRA